MLGDIIMYDIDLIKKEIKKLETKKQKLIEFSSCFFDDRASDRM